MIIDHVETLADALGVDTEVPSPCCANVGYLYSRAGFILGRIEEKLGIRRSKELLGARVRRCMHESIAS